MLVERHQALDELTQRAEALAVIAHRLAASEVENAPSPTELVAGIPLGGLVRRLTGDSESVREPRSGEVEVF
jgi:hypothetical protein